MAVRYYKTDSRRIRLREWWRICPSPVILIPWILKFIGVRFRAPEGMPRVERARDMVVAESGLDPALRDRLAPLVGQIRSLGFSVPCYLKLKNSLMNINESAALALCWRQGGEHAALVAACRVQDTATLETTFVSELCDGTVVATGNNHRRFDPPPGVHALHDTTASVDQLFELHSQRVAELTDESSVVTVTSEEDVLLLQDKIVNRVFDYMTRRGVWVEMTQHEIDALKQRTST